MLGLSSFIVGILAVSYELGTKHCSHRPKDLKKTGLYTLLLLGYFAEAVL